MKSKDFVVIKEDIVDAAQHMQKDHEVQMARAQLYSAAEAAIDIHRMLRSVSEQEGLEGWVSAKITLAQDYLNTIREYLKYENTDDMAPPSFDPQRAGDSLDDLLGEAAGGMGVGGIATTTMPMPGHSNPFKRRKVKEQTPAVPTAGQTPAPAANQTAAPAGQTPPAGQAPAANQTAAPAAGQQPANPGQPAPAGQTPPAGQQPAKPGQPAPAGTATPPNPAQVKKDTDMLAGVLNNPASPLNAELQALLKKAAALPK